jgi:transglutaminase-like putative cysteine protease
VLLVAGVGGLAFTPVFDFWSLLKPIAAILLACSLAVEVSLRLLPAWRSLLVAGAGLLALVETELWSTTLVGLPTGRTLRALVAGATQSWQLTLQSTWPARPDPELLLFVPLAVIAVAVAGLELTRWAPAALLPSLLVVGGSQAYAPLTGWAAAGVALAYAVAAGGLLVVSKHGPVVRQPTVWLPTVALALVGAVLVTLLDPVTPAYSLRQDQGVTPPATLANPLEEIAGDLRKPAEPVFSYTSGTKVDRWRLAVFDGFDGATWKSTSRLRRMGRTVALPASVTVPTAGRQARVSMPDPSDPFLPSQPLPTMVVGATPYLDQSSGVLVGSGAATYDLSWREPVVDPRLLADASIDPHAEGGFAGLGTIPPGISELATRAAGGLRPSFQTALVLERFLGENYKVAVGDNLPTGAGWPQLTSFLLQSKRGTSEQFASAYVVLARILGIPARLAVGFRGGQPDADGRVTVRNGDVLAWPEVAVAGVGWVPLDPTRTAAGSGIAGTSATGLAAAAAMARSALPPSNQLHDSPVASESDADFSFNPIILLVPVVLLLVFLVGMPIFRLVRTWRRRRLTGTAGVMAAWAEVRDLLRAHGIRVTRSMTVRDVAVASSALTGHLGVLAVLLDSTLWSGGAPQAGAVDAAWAAVELVRRDLARRSPGRRVRAVFHVASLRAP